MCILCRKKQEIQSKTGQWFNRGGPTDPMGRPMTETEVGLMQQDPSDKRPKLERAQSAAEKENLPLQRSGSCLRRQYSQQEQPTTSRRLSSSEMGSGIPGGGGGSEPMGHRRHPHGGGGVEGGGGGGPYGHKGPYQHMKSLQQQQQYGFQQYQSAHSQQQGLALSRTQSSNYPDDDPSFYQVRDDQMTRGGKGMIEGERE